MSSSRGCLAPPPMPEMPVRVVVRRGVASGPSELQCRPADGRGCGLLMAYVGGALGVSPDDLSRVVEGIERWECWTCWRAVEVRWSVAP